MQEIAFGQVVRERRRALDLTQDALARRVACAAITVRKIESGALRPSQQIAERLAVALAVPPDDRAAFVHLARRSLPDGRETPQPPPTPPPTPEEVGLEDLSGRAVCGYQLGERIGSGGFGAVYRAMQPLVGREVAVKIILPRFADQPEFIRRFEAEAQMIARLEHPHIVPLYDYWREPGVAYLSGVGFLLRRVLKRSVRQGSYDMTVKTFRPGFRDQLHGRERVSMNERGHKPQAAPVQATQAPQRSLSGCPSAGDMRFRQGGQHDGWLGRLGVTSDADDPQRGERQREPEPLGPARVGHLGLFPLPTTPLHGLVAGFDPGAQAVPGHIGHRRREVGQHQPRIPIARIPARHQRTRPLALRGRKTAHGSLPATAVHRHALAERTKGVHTVRAIGALAVNPQERMPAQRGNGLKQPLRIQPPAGRDNDRPGGGHTALKVLKERFPMRLPGTFGRRTHHRPRHRDRAAPDEHMNREDSEPLAERRGVHAQGEVRTVGGMERHHPAQQGSKTGRYLQTAALVTAFGPGFGRGIAIPVAELFAHRLLAATQQIREDDRDLGQATALGEHDAENSTG